jgi:hypothetical protein
VRAGPAPSPTLPPADPARAAFNAEAAKVVALCLAAGRPDLTAACIGMTVDQARHTIAVESWAPHFAKACRARAAQTGEPIAAPATTTAATGEGWGAAFDRVHGRG